MTKLNAYAGYDKDLGSSEGAVLIFAHTAKEAKRIGYRAVCSWYDTHWLDMSVRRMHENVEYLYGDADAEKLKNNIPHVNESPRYCPNCNYWGGGEIIDGTCAYCVGEDDYA